MLFPMPEYDRRRRQRHADRKHHEPGSRDIEFLLAREPREPRVFRLD